MGPLTNLQIDRHTRSDRPILYTAIFGKKDPLIEDHHGVEGWRRICFTDDPNLHAHDTEVVVVPRISLDPVRCARHYKLLPHIHLPNAPFSVWIDGSIRIVADDFPDLVEGWLGNASVATLQHPKRNCVYEEGRRVLELGKDDPDLVRRQIAEYETMGVPSYLGLHMTAIVCRRHASDDVRALDEQWWDFVLRFSRRDQLSFDVSRWMTHCAVHTIPYPPRVDSPPWFVLNDHAIPEDFGSRPPLRARVLDWSRSAAASARHRSPFT